MKELKWRTWHDMSIKEYLTMEKELKQYEVGKLKRLFAKLAYLYDISLEEVENLDLIEYNELLEQSKVFFEDMPSMNPLTSIELDDTNFDIMYDLYTYSVERYSDIELYLEKHEVYEREIPMFCLMLKNGDYNGNALLGLQDEVGEMSVVMFYSCLNFFLRNYVTFKAITTLSTIPMEERTLTTEVEATLTLLSMLYLQTSIG